MKYASSDFLDLKNPSAFTSVHKVNKQTGISKDAIRKELLKIDAYKLHHPAPNKFKRRQVFSPYQNAIWGMDLVEIRDKKANWNKSFILTVIDFFDRYAWFETLKSKHADEVLSAFQRIIQRSGRKPEKVTSDHGREIKNQKFNKYCQENNIVQYFTNSPLKCSMCERLNRTLFQMIAKYSTHFKTKRFVQKLPLFENIYNNSYHRSIRMTPAQVTTDNSGKVFSTLYGKPSVKPKAKISVGDTVLRKLDKPLFTKGYSQTFESEPYKVYMVRDTNPPTYIIENEEGRISRAYYQPELLKL